MIFRVHEKLEEIYKKKKRQCFEIRARNFVRSFRDATEPANATNRISMPTGLRNCTSRNRKLDKSMQPYQKFCLT